MPTLLFLTGAPGSGKSTLARLLVEERPLALLLDIDALRGQLGGWRADPGAAGVHARRLALALSGEQLRQDADVVVPQFVRRPELIEQFRDLATAMGSRFALVALVSSPEEAAARFRARSGSNDPLHRDAAFLQDSADAQPVEDLYADMVTMLASFPETRYVESVPGEVDMTLAAVREAFTR